MRRAAGAIVVVLQVLIASQAHAAQRVLQVGDAQTLQIPSATAAWPVDGTVADVTVRNGAVTITGRGAGQTRIFVLAMDGQLAFDVVVEAAKSRAAAPRTAASPAAATTVVDSRYSSGERELRNDVTMTRDERHGRTELHLQSVHAAAAADRRGPSTATPSVSYRMFRSTREITLFDRSVDHSPLTLQNEVLRGIHYLDPNWRLHAGVTTYSAYRSFLLPVERRFIAGAGYEFPVSSRLSMTPSLFLVRGRGEIASMLARYAQGDRISVASELAYSHGAGAALQIAFANGGQEARADVRYRARGFVTAEPVALHGFLGDASWSRTWQSGSFASLSVSATSSPELNEHLLTTSADAERRLTRHVALLGGGAFTRINGVSATAVPLGVRIDADHASLTVLARMSDASNADHAAPGFRVAGRVFAGSFSAMASIDRQASAPSLSAIYSADPALALAVADLGLSIQSPSALAAALRDNGALRSLGFISGGNVELVPQRTLTTVELTWIGHGDARPQLRLRWNRNDVERITGSSLSSLGSITWSQRLTAASDVFAAFKWWVVRVNGEREARPIIEAGVRHRFDGAPALFGAGAISGIVTADPNADGVTTGPGLPGVEVQLDHRTTVRTDASGAFAFRNVPHGDHDVTARLTAAADGYFTTASSVVAEPGERVNFGVAMSPARLIGTVATDAGEPLAGVRLVLTNGTRRVDVVTSSSGAYEAVTAPGSWTVEIDRDSVPPGFATGSLHAEVVSLTRAEPRRLDHVLLAQRAIRGAGARGGAEVRLEPAGLRVRADASGRFVLRDVPAGELTVISGTTSRRVSVPRTPASVAVDLADRRG